MSLLRMRRKWPAHGNVMIHRVSVIHFFLIDTCSCEKNVSCLSIPVRYNTYHNKAYLNYLKFKGELRQTRRFKWHLLSACQFSYLSFYTLNGKYLQSPLFYKKSLLSLNKY